MKHRIQRWHCFEILIKTLITFIWVCLKTIFKIISLQILLLVTAKLSDHFISFRIRNYISVKMRTKKSHLIPQFICGTNFIAVSALFLPFLCSTSASEVDAAILWTFVFPPRELVWLILIIIKQLTVLFCNFQRQVPLA